MLIRLYNRTLHKQYSLDAVCTVCAVRAPFQPRAIGAVARAGARIAIGAVPTRCAIYVA